MRRRHITGLQDTVTDDAIGGGIQFGVLQHFSGQCQLRLIYPEHGPGLFDVLNARPLDGQRQGFQRHPQIGTRGVHVCFRIVHRLSGRCLFLIQIPVAFMGYFGITQSGFRGSNLCQRLADLFGTAAGFKPGHHCPLGSDLGLGGRILGLHTFLVQCRQQLSLVYTVTFLYQDFVDMLTVIECEVDLADIDVPVQHQPGGVIRILVVEVPPAATGHGQQQRNDQWANPLFFVHRLQLS